jgi:hypothetical protein
MYHFARAGLAESYLTANPEPNGRVYLVVNTAEGFTLNSPLREPFLWRYSHARLLRVFPEHQKAGESSSAEIYVLTAE